MFKITSSGKMILTRGDTCEFSIELKNCDGTIYIPGANDIVLFTLKKDLYKEIPIFEKTGLIIHIDSDDTKDLPVATYYYDVKILFENGEVQTVIPINLFEILQNVGDWHVED